MQPHSRVGHASRGVLAALVLVSLILGACSSSSSNQPLSMPGVRKMVRDAERAGAEREPLARFHLRLAKQQLARAQEAQSNERFEEAGRLLARAEADARLALNRVLETRDRRKADRARVEVEELRVRERRVKEQRELRQDLAPEREPREPRGQP